MIDLETKLEWIAAFIEQNRCPKLDLFQTIDGMLSFIDDLGQAPDHESRLRALRGMATMASTLMTLTFRGESLMPFPASSNCQIAIWRISRLF